MILNKKTFLIILFLIKSYNSFCKNDSVINHVKSNLDCYFYSNFKTTNIGGINLTRFGKKQIGYMIGCSFLQYKKLDDSSFEIGIDNNFITKIIKSKIFDFDFMIGGREKMTFGSFKNTLIGSGKVNYNLFVLEFILGLDLRFNVSRTIQIGSGIIGGYGYGFFIKKDISEKFNPNKYKSYFYFEPRLIISFKLK